MSKWFERRIPLKWINKSFCSSWLNFCYQAMSFRISSVHELRSTKFVYLQLHVTCVIFIATEKSAARIAYRDAAWFSFYDRWIASDTTLPPSQINIYNGNDNVKAKRYIEEE